LTQGTVKLGSFEVRVTIQLGPLLNPPLSFAAIGWGHILMIGDSLIVNHPLIAFRLYYDESLILAGPQLENIPGWGKIILTGSKRMFGGGAKYTKYNNINNNSENFRGQDWC